MFRECTRCHQPYPEASSFAENDKRCNACQRKYLKERQRRVDKQQQQQQQQQLIKTTPKKRKATIEYSKSPRENEENDEDENDEDESDDGGVFVDLDSAVRLALKTLDTWKTKTKRKRYAVILL